MGEKTIIIAGTALLGIGLWKAFTDQKPIDKPLIGGLVVILLLSGIALFGPDAADLAGKFALATLVGALLLDGPDLFKSISSVVGA